MSEAKHTPGPWVLKSDEEKIVGANEHTIVVYELNTNPADHALLAAAPDLLEALEQVRRHLKTLPTNEGNAVWEQINAAISKAQGLP